MVCPQGVLSSNRFLARVGRICRVGVSTGRQGTSRCPPGRFKSGERVRCNAEDFTTAAGKSSLDVVEWSEDFNNHYTLGTEVAVGSFGKVWRGRERTTGDPVAVKRIKMQQGTPHTEEVREKVDREVAVLKQLQGHRGIAKLHGCLLHERNYSLVTDFYSGKDLRANVKLWGPISEGLCAAVAWEVLAVLRHCREARVVHGDVKAANFMVASGACNPFRNSDIRELPAGWMKAVDFGEGRYLRGGTTDELRGRCGTLVYMAPEVLLGCYGFPADMWSAGIMMFFMLSGRYPWWERTEVALRQNLRQVQEAVCCQPLRIDPEAVGNPSPSCMDLLSRLLVRESNLRMTLEQAEAHPFFEENLAICENGTVILGSDSNKPSASIAELCPVRWAIEGMS
ncbi:hypothetical protein BSKO_02232 [Bryopsis sp. KO-2023]|nr:hypothetical protein BSKO_02232 [Bryopsis sp. KO-2023]